MIPGPYVMPRADPTDVMGQRIAAYVIDTLIALVVVGAVALPVFFSEVDRVSTHRSDYCTSFNNQHDRGFCVVSGGTAYTLTASKLSRLSQSFYGAFLVWTLLNSGLLQGLTGGTIGKLLLGLRVLRADGQRAGIGRCVLRTIPLLLIDSLCFVIGLVVALSTKGHRRVGDMIASTLVVPKEYEGQPIVVPGLNTSWTPPASYTAPSAPAGAPPSGDGPTWDPARNAYIQYDRSKSAWVQWDDQSKQWKPIDQP